MATKTGEGHGPPPTPETADSARQPTFAVGTGEVQMEQPPHVVDLANLEVSFERAIQLIWMAFQPIVFPDRKVFAWEALLRSHDHELKYPDVLLDAAEKLSRLEKLSRTIRMKVAKTFATEPEERGLLFVNLHALDLMDKALLSRFSPLAKISQRVVLEITERASLESVDDLRYRVAELREMGYRIAIDDLGAGHARMHQFTPLDTDFVKLDMSLVRDLDSHPVKQQLVASVTRLCRDQGILVIGEGVETEAEERVLVDLGCDLLQGYLIAKPGPPFPVVS